MSDVSRILKEARSQSRLTTLDYAEQIFDDFYGTTWRSSFCR